MEIFGREILTATSGDIKKVLGEHLDKVVICMETATGLSGISNVLCIDKVQVYCESKHKNDIEKLEQVEIVKVVDFENIDIITVDEIKCTGNVQTLKDLLDTKCDRDYGMLIDTFADYYYMHDESFDELKKELNEHQIKVLDDCMWDIEDNYKE